MKIYIYFKQFKRAQNRNCIFLKCAVKDVILRVNTALFWRVLFRSWPQKGFTPRGEMLGINLITISMNYTLTPINAIILNASAKKLTNYLADSLWENRKSLKLFPQSAKKLSIRKTETPTNWFFWVRKTQICWLVQIRLWRRVSLPCQPTVNNFLKCIPQEVKKKLFNGKNGLNSS